MCGIFGFYSRTAYSSASMWQMASTLQKALHHRGPNDFGWHMYDVGGKCTATQAQEVPHEAPPSSLLLGQTRLSIIDLSAAGHQPMRTRDGRYSLVYNGEIYNYLEIRRELEQQGISFLSQTDSEVLLYALSLWGQACLPRLEGMFAFAFYDSHAQTLLCARDAFGIKPLYWSKLADGSFCFASELPALLTIPGVHRRLNWQSAFNFFAVAREGVGYETFVQGVYQLPPAHLLQIDTTSGDISPPKQWWQVPLNTPLKISFDDAAEEVRRLFLLSIQQHMRSDVPVGVALSGGVDSSAVACCIRHLHPDFPLHAFSYVASEDSSISEERWLRQAAHHTQAVLHTTSPSESFLLEYADDVILRLNEPFSSTGLMAQYQVHKLAKEQGGTVLLNGEGGDEALGGYDGYLDERIRTLLGRGSIGAACSFYRAATLWPGRSKKQTLLRLIKAYLPHWTEPLGRQIMRKPLFPSWLCGQAIHAHNAGQLLSRDANVYFSPDILRLTLANSLTFAGCPNLLRYGDRCAAAFSLENRVPFLNIPFVNFCLSLPEEYLVSMKGETKSVFRKAMRGIVPDVLLDRKDKIGFASPEKQWLFNSRIWVEETLSKADDSALFQACEVKKFWKDMYSGKRPYDGVLWRILCYLRWKTLLNIKE